MQQVNIARMLANIYHNALYRLLNFSNSHVFKSVYFFCAIVSAIKELRLQNGSSKRQTPAAISGYSL